MHPDVIIRIVLATVLAVVPAAIWGYIFYKKQQGQKRMLLVTFVTGAFFVTPLLIYKYLWQYFPWLNAFQYAEAFDGDLVGLANFSTIPLSVVVTFMLVGVIEEVTKLWAVKVTDKGRICSVDDAIEMFIMAALGFSFAENMVYFYNIIASRGPDGILYPFIFRSLFSTFAHIMFSGILGYYYGLALFATDVLKSKHNKKKYSFIRVLSRIFHFRRSTFFHDEKITEGLLIATTLHAIFNIFLEMNWVFLLVPFLTGGYIYVSHLLEMKEDAKVYAQVDGIRND